MTAIYNFFKILTCMLNVEAKMLNCYKLLAKKDNTVSFYNDMLCLGEESASKVNSCFPDFVWGQLLHRIHPNFLIGKLFSHS